MIHDIQRTSSPANVNPANSGTTTAASTNNTASRSSGPMQVMLSRQAEMHRILLEEHQKLQKSHHQLCEKLMLETRQLVNNKNNSIRGRSNGRTFTRSPAPTTATNNVTAMSGTRIPRSVSLQRISASKSVMDLRFVSDRVNHHHHSQANLNHNSGDEHEEDDDGDSDDHHADHHVNELRQQVTFMTKSCSVGIRWTH